MNKEEEDKQDDDLGSTDLVRFINSLHEIQLPSIIKKNLFTAVGKLITGSADAGVAHLQAHVEKVKARSEAEALIIKKNAEAVANEFNQDPALVSRAVTYYGNRLLKDQQNRETPIQLALDELKSKQSTIDAENEIDEDWLDLFTKVVETKSDKDIQLIFAKILAGEINQPGSYSPKTIQDISFLTKPIALSFIKLFGCFFLSRAGSEVNPHIVIKEPLEIMSWTINNQSKPAMFFIRRLQDIGLVRTDKVFLEYRSISFTTWDIQIGREHLRFAGDNDFSKNVEFLTLTNSGMELGNLIEHGTDKEYLKSCISWVTKQFKVELMHQKTQSEVEKEEFND